MKRKITLLLFTFLYTAVFSQQVLTKDAVFKEAEDARFCGDIVVKTYDSIEVNGVWILDKLIAHRMDLCGEIDPNFHRTAATVTSRQAFWPKVGDTCFVIIDRVNYHSVILFGFGKGDDYCFWDPYSDSPETVTISKNEFWKCFKEFRDAGRGGC